MFRMLLCLSTLILVACPVLPGMAQERYPTENLPGGKAAGHQPPSVQAWTMRNQCHEPIRFALHYQEVGGGVVTRGWWRLRPGGEVTIETMSEWISYVAFRVSGNRLTWIWDPNGPRYRTGHIEHDFSYVEDVIPPNIPGANFIRISVLEQPTTTLCP